MPATDPAVDFGPSIRERAIVQPPQRLPSGRPGPPRPAVVLREAQVVREDRADPEAPNRTVRGGRYLDPLRLMHERGTLSKERWHAVERFRDLLALAEGAKVADPDLSGVRVGGTSGPDPAMSRLDAQARVRGAWAVVGLARSGVVAWCVVSYGTLVAYAEAKRVDRGRATAMLMAALDDLDAHFQDDPVGRALAEAKARAKAAAAKRAREQERRSPARKA